MAVPIVFDRRLYAVRRAKAEALGGDSFLVRDAAEGLSERITSMNREFARGLDLGSRAQSFAIVEACGKTWLRTRLTERNGAHIAADEEALPFAPASFDLVTSVLGLHAVNDLPGALIQIRRLLAPGGLFVAALFGGATLGELRRALAAGEADIRSGASPRVAPFADVRDMGALLQRAGFAMPVADRESITVRYRSFATLVQDVRAMGETSALAVPGRRRLSRAVISAALESYLANDSDAEGRLNATYEMLYLTGRAAD